jgi:hypothetical protein
LKDASPQGAMARATLWMPSVLWMLFCWAGRGDEPVSPEGSEVLATLVRTHRQVVASSRERNKVAARLASMVSEVAHREQESCPAGTEVGVRATPFGVTKPAAWPASRTIPSNKITIHLSAAGVNVTGGVDVKMLKYDPDTDGTKSLIDGTLLLSDMYIINMGPGAAGDYVVQVRLRGPGGAIVGTAMDLFTIEPDHPDAAGYEGSPCKDLPGLPDEEGRPAVNIPPALCDRYTMNGRVGIGRDYYDDFR